MFVYYICYVGNNSPRVGKKNRRFFFVVIILFQYLTVYRHYHQIHIMYIERDQVNQILC